MKKLLIILLYFCAFIQCQCQKTKLDMDTIYQKKINHLSIKFIRSLQDSTYYWETQLINTANNKKIILYKDSIVKDFAWEQFERIGEGYTNFYNISGTFIRNKDVYIVYNKMGDVFISKYHFTASNEFTEETQSLSKYSVIPRDGRLTNEAHFSIIDNSMFLGLCIGQDRSSIELEKELFKISDSFEIKKLVFKPNPLVLNGIFPNEGLKSDYNELLEKQEAKTITKQELEALTYLKEYMLKPYYLKSVSTDPDIQHQTIENYFKQKWELFDFFPDKLQFNQRDLINGYIKDVVNYSNQKTDSMELLGWMEFDFRAGTIQFSMNNDIFLFYRNQYANMKILRYKQYYPTWIVGDYTEEKIKAEE